MSNFPPLPPQIHPFVDKSGKLSSLSFGWLLALHRFLNASGGISGGDGGAVARLGSYLTYASPAGARNNVNPGGGWPTAIGQLDVTLAAGNANWTGLAAGASGQVVMITNNDATNQLTLNNLNAGSLTANQFRYSADLVLPPGATALACYNSTASKWVLR